MVKAFNIFSCAALVAASLAVAATNIAPANAMVNDTTRPVVDEAVEPISELKLSTVKLVRERVEPNTAEFTRMAGRRTAKMRRRVTAPRRVNRNIQRRPRFSTYKSRRRRKPTTPRTLGSGQGPVPCDCSNCSAEHCHHRPVTGSGYDGYPKDFYHSDMDQDWIDW